MPKQSKRGKRHFHPRFKGDTFARQQADKRKAESAIKEGFEVVESVNKTTAVAKAKLGDIDRRHKESRERLIYHGLRIKYLVEYTHGKA